jgi:hypothetical protein
MLNTFNKQRETQLCAKEESKLNHATTHIELHVIVAS